MRRPNLRLKPATPPVATAGLFALVLTLSGIDPASSAKVERCGRFDTEYGTCFNHVKQDCDGEVSCVRQRVCKECGQHAMHPSATPRRKMVLFQRYVRYCELSDQEQHARNLEDEVRECLSGGPGSAAAPSAPVASTEDRDCDAVAGELHRKRLEYQRVYGRAQQLLTHIEQLEAEEQRNCPR